MKFSARIGIVFLLVLLATACSPKTKTSANDNAIGDDDETVSPLAPAEALADTWIATYTPEVMGWNWDSGLLMLGIWELYQRTGDRRYHDYVQEWLDYNIGIGYEIAFNDDVPPARLALRLWQETGNAKYRKVVDDTRYYIFDEAKRLPNGALNHMGWISNAQMWLDTLYMVTFLLELGVADNDTACFDLSIQQFEVFAAQLRDADTGMYHHMYDASTNKVTPSAKIYWGRGNAWVIAASGLAMQLLPKGYAGRDGIRDRFLQQAAAMGALIDKTNRWRTIMNLPQTYLETSVGALVAAGIYGAAAAGEADDSLLTVARRGLRGALDQAVKDESGNTLLVGTSYGTAPSEWWEMYNYVVKGEQVSYGVGAVLLAVAAYEDFEPKQPLPAAQATNDTYIHAPAADNQADWGYFYAARGDFGSAAASFAKAPADDAAAQFGAGLIETVLYVYGVLDSLDRYELGQADLAATIDAVLSTGRTTGEDLAKFMPVAENDAAFSRILERIVLTGTGGSSALGEVEVGRGEAYLLDGAGHLLWGLEDIVESLGVDGAKQLAETDDPLGLLLDSTKAFNKTELAAGLQELIAGIDLLVDAINAIMSETLDQSLALIPKNLLELTGDFKLPGILLPEPVGELLGPIAKFFAGKPMPATLVEYLQTARELLTLVSDLVG